MRKQLIIVTMAGCLALAGATNAWAHDSSTKAGPYQKIHQGIHSGELTKGETRALVKEQHHLRNARQRAWADNVLTRAEKIRLVQMRERADRHIYRLKHNDIKRW